MPLPQLWAALFFFMLITVAFDSTVRASMFILVETFHIGIMSSELIPATTLSYHPLNCSSHQAVHLIHSILRTFEPNRSFFVIFAITFCIPEPRSISLSFCLNVNCSYTLIRRYNVTQNLMKKECVPMLKIFKPILAFLSFDSKISKIIDLDRLYNCLVFSVETYAMVKRVVIHILILY